jgi:hypothetical protein
MEMTMRSSTGLLIGAAFFAALGLLLLLFAADQTEEGAHPAADPPWEIIEKPPLTTIEPAAAPRVTLDPIMKTHPTIKQHESPTR